MDVSAATGSFLLMMKEHKGIIYKVANTYCNNQEDRKDLIQEISIQLWLAFSSYNGRFKLSTFIYRIALNVSISFYRKTKRREPLSHPFSESIMSIAQDNPPEEKNENLALLQKFIQELQELDKAVILLYLDDVPQKEIAEILGLSETNISTKINRIKTKLKQKFSTM